MENNLRLLLLDLFRGTNQRELYRRNIKNLQNASQDEILHGLLLRKT